MGGIQSKQSISLAPQPHLCYLFSYQDYMLQRLQLWRYIVLTLGRFFFRKKNKYAWR
jgi:hypothetical protein